MRDDLGACLERASAGAELAPDVLNRLFRSAHSLKGLSGMFGLEALAELAHRIEDLLDAWRLGRAQPTVERLALFEESVELFGRALEQLASGGLEARFGDVAAALIARIAAENTPSGAARAVEPNAIDAPAPLLRALTEYEEHRLRENLARGRAIHVVTAVFQLASFEERLSEISTALREVGEVLSTLPSPGDGGPGEIRFALLAATDLDAASLAARLELSPTAIHIARPGRADAAAKVAPSPDPSTVEPEPTATSDVRESGPEAEAATLRSVSDTVRVDIRKLDELMNLVGELAIERGALSTFARRLAAEPGLARLGAELEKIHKALDRKLQELQASVIEVRMVPLRQVFDKLSRVVRRLRLDLGKEARLEIKGADTELDKLIVEELVDPADARRAQRLRSRDRDARGAPRGRQASRGRDSARGDAARKRRRDYGRRRRPRHRRAARAREGDRTRADPADRAAQRTRDARPRVPARALDAQRSHRDERSRRRDGRGAQQRLGARRDRRSRFDAGRGTTLTLTLPITLAIIQALVVGVGDERYAIPLNAVREVLIPSADALQRSGTRELLALRGEALPVLRLRDEFAVRSGTPAAKPFAVILGLGDARLALLVDRLEGQHDTVIKPIQGPVRSVRGIAGATELGDRCAVLVLDVAALVSSAPRAEAA